MDDAVESFEASTYEKLMSPMRWEDPKGWIGMTSSATHAYGQLNTNVREHLLESSRSNSL
jgi:hypothetical protein